MFGELWGPSGGKQNGYRLVPVLRKLRPLCAWRGRDFYRDSGASERPFEACTLSLLPAPSVPMQREFDGGEQQSVTLQLGPMSVQNQRPSDRGISRISVIALGTDTQEIPLGHRHCLIGSAGTRRSS